MHGLSAAAAVDFEATVFLGYFKDMPDHRVTGAKVLAFRVAQRV